MVLIIMWVKQALVLVIISSVFSPIIAQECDHINWETWDNEKCSTTTSGNTGTDGPHTAATDANGSPATLEINAATDSSGNLAPDDTFGNPLTSGINAATHSSGNLAPDGTFGNPSTSGINAVTGSSGNLAPDDTFGNPSTSGINAATDSSDNLSRATPTDDPNDGLSPDQYATKSTLNTNAKNSTGLVSIFNYEVSSGQIPSVLPTDEGGNSISGPNSDSAGEHGNLVAITSGDDSTVPSHTDSTDSSIKSTTTERNPNELVTDGATDQFSTYSPSTEVPTNTDGNDESADELTQKYADIYNTSTNTTSGVHRIGRGVCGLRTGGPLIQPAVPPVTSLSNSLVWSGRHRALYLVDGLKPALLKYTPSNGNLVTLTLDGALVQTVLPTSSRNQYVVELGHKLVLLENPFSKDENVTVYKKVLVVFHKIYDLGVAKPDSNGRIWIPVRVKTSSNEIIDQLYLIWKGKAELKATFSRNKGMAWSPDNKLFYVVDCAHERDLLYVYDFDQKTADIKNRRVLFNLNDYPDLSGQITNIAVDSSGNVWASIYQGSSIIKIDHRSGELLEIVPLPTNYPVSLAFGNSARDVLFVGTAYNDSSKTDAPYVYAVSDLNVKGTDASKEIKLTTTFGSETIDVTVSKTADAPVNDSPSLNETTCGEIKELLATAKPKRIGCTIVKDTPIVQEAIAPINTSGSSLYWNFDTNAMYFADVGAPAVIKYTPLTGKIVTVKLENITTVASITPIRHKDHNYILSTDNLIVQFNNKFETNTAVNISGKPIASLKDKNMVFSRARTDNRGRLWIGTKFLKRTRTKCKLYMLQKGKLVSKISKVIASGGMTWSLDNAQFYFADSGEGKIYSYKYNKFSGAIANRAVFFDIAKDSRFNGTIEDLTTDSKDNIWATVSSDGVVIQLNRETGDVEQMISLPIKYPVSLEFGGVKRDTLFVISAQDGTCKIDGMPFTYAIRNLGVGGTHANYNYVL